MCIAKYTVSSGHMKCACHNDFYNGAEKNPLTKLRGAVFFVDQWLIKILSTSQIKLLTANINPYPTFSEIPEDTVTWFRYRKFPNIQTRIFCGLNQTN